MPVHDWSRVAAGLFHDFHHAWIEELKRVLNAKVLPPEYYAMAEQFAAGFGPDVLTVQAQSDPAPPESPPGAASIDGNVALFEPKLQVTGDTEMEFYRRRQTRAAVRHVSDDRVVAMIEVVSPGNKNSRHGIESFVRKTAELLDQRIHLLILDLLSPGPRDPHGIHARIWEYIEGVELPQPERPLSLASYEADLTVRASVLSVSIGDRLPDMPLFLAPQKCVEVPLEESYLSAFDAFPRRLRRVLESPTRDIGSAMSVRSPSVS